MWTVSCGFWGEADLGICSMIIAPLGARPLSSILLRPRLWSQWHHLQGPGGTCRLSGPSAGLTTSTSRAGSQPPIREDLASAVVEVATKPVGSLAVAQW